MAKTTKSLRCTVYVVGSSQKIIKIGKGGPENSSPHCSAIILQYLLR